MQGPAPLRIDIVAATEIAKKCGVQEKGPASFEDVRGAVIVRLGGAKHEGIMVRRAGKGPSYQLLYLSSLRFASKLPPPPRGAAVLDDGSHYFVSDPAELRAFFRRCEGELDGFIVASLLLRFQNDGADQCLIDNLAEVAALVDVNVVRKLRGFTLPAARGGEQGFGIDFCSWTVPSPSDPTATIRRWSVGMDAHGELTWKSDVIGSEIRSSFFRS